MKATNLIIGNPRFNLIESGEDGGAGTFNCNGGVKVRVIWSTGGGWDHVSVSLPNRVPTYDEMRWVKSAFFQLDEWAVEYHAPKTEHINCHPFTLHLWRPQNVELPTPPKVMV